MYTPSLWKYVMLIDLQTVQPASKWYQKEGVLREYSKTARERDDMRFGIFLFLKSIRFGIG